MKSKHQAPQSEFTATSTVFNLITDMAVDGERVRQEMEKAATEAALAKALEEKQQSTLL